MFPDAPADNFPAIRWLADDLVARGLRAPVLAIIGGNPGLRRAVSEACGGAALRRSQVLTVFRFPKAQWKTVAQPGHSNRILMTRRVALTVTLATFSSTLLGQNAINLENILVD